MVGVLPNNLEGFCFVLHLEGRILISQNKIFSTKSAEKLKQNQSRTLCKLITHHSSLITYNSSLITYNSSLDKGLRFLSQKNPSNFFVSLPTAFMGINFPVGSW